TVLQRRRRQRRGETVALAQSASQRGEGVHLFGAFDALRDRLELQRVREADDGGDQAAASRFLAQPAEERALDLEYVDREAVEVAEGGLAGAEIVDGEPDPQPL